MAVIPVVEVDGVVVSREYDGFKNTFLCKAFLNKEAKEYIRDNKLERTSDDHGKCTNHGLAFLGGLDTDSTELDVIMIMPPFKKLVMEAGNTKIYLKTVKGN